MVSPEADANNQCYHCIDSGRMLEKKIVLQPRTTPAYGIDPVGAPVRKLRGEVEAVTDAAYGNDVPAGQTELAAQPAYMYIDGA